MDEREQTYGEKAVGLSFNPSGTEGCNMAAAQGQISGACRQGAKSLLRDRVHRLRREADQLEALIKSLPEELPHIADEALWNLAINAR
jgi:glycine/D-amino acid oxidase-like deaminating enzyme